MIIKKLSIKAFGKMKNSNIILKPGFNVIYGENESGKSTIQAFIKGVFYGLSKKNKKGEVPEQDKYNPWNSQEYAGAIEYEEDGFNYRVGRNFNTNKVSVCNEFWDDITEQFPSDKKKGSLFAQEHMGISEDCFERTIFIKQMETRISDDDKEISDRLLNIQESGQENISLKKAINELESTIKENIGSEKTSKKPLNLINAQIDGLLKEKAEVIKLRTEILSLEEEINEKEDERDKLSQMIEYQKDVKQTIKREDLLQLYNKAKEYENNIEDVENEIIRYERYGTFPTHLEERLREILFEMKNHQKILDEKKEKLDEAEARIKAANDEITGNKDSEAIFSAISDFELLKQFNKEKLHSEIKLESFNTKISKLTRKLEERNSIEIPEGTEMEVVNYENQLSEIEKKISKIDDIKDQLRKIDYQAKSIGITLPLVKKSKMPKRKYSLYDLENNLSSYDRMTNNKERVSEENKAISRVMEEIEQAEFYLESLKAFSKLPDDIENKVARLLSASPVSVNEEQDYFVSKIRLFIYTMITLLFVGLFIMGAYNLVDNPGVFSFILTPISGVLSITGIIIIVRVFESLVNGNKDDNIIEIQDQDNQNARELKEIFVRVGVEDSIEFTKKINEYKEIKSILVSLKLELQTKKDHIENINNLDIDDKKEILNVLDLFGIIHEPDTISEANMKSLRDKFNNTAAQTLKGNISVIEELSRKRNKIISDMISTCDLNKSQGQDAQDIYNNFIFEKEKIQNKLQRYYDKLKITHSRQIFERMKEGISLCAEIDLASQEVISIEEVLSEQKAKVDQIDSKIKTVLNNHSINYDSKDIIKEEHISELKNKFKKLHDLTGEISLMEKIKEELIFELREIENRMEPVIREKEELLESAGVESEEEFLDNCKKNEKLKEFFTQKDKLTTVYRELLKGETSQEILERISQLKVNSTPKVDEIKSIEETDAKIEELKETLKKLDENIINLKNEVENKLKGKMDLNQIVEQLGWLQEQKLSLEDKKCALEVAIDVIKESSKEIQRDFSPKFQKEISAIISRITGGKYKEVKANEKLKLNVSSPDAGHIVGVDMLSAGTVEQFYLSLRIALSNLLSGDNEKLPLIIDEAFVQYDDKRVKNVIQFLLEESKIRQIIVFTCQRRELEIIKALGATKSANIIELEA